MWDAGPEGFTMFFTEAEPRLRRALVGVHGAAGRDATAEALAYGWQHWERVRRMDNPIGYLYRVGRSRARTRKAPPAYPPPHDGGEHDWYEPGLPQALAGLSERERLAVVLIEGFGWTYRDVADLAGTSTSSIQSYRSRGLAKLRAALGASPDA